MYVLHARSLDAYSHRRAHSVHSPRLRYQDSVDITIKPTLWCPNPFRSPISSSPTSSSSSSIEITSRRLARPGCPLQPFLLGELRFLFALPALPP